MLQNHGSGCLDHARISIAELLSDGALRAQASRLKGKPFRVGGEVFFVPSAKGVGATERNARAQAHTGKPRIRFRKARQLHLYGTIHQAQALGDSFGNRPLGFEGLRAQNGGVDRLRLMESFATAP